MGATRCKPSITSIREADFLPYSYGYRPNKSTHQALHRLALNLQFKGYGFIIEAASKGFLMIEA